MKHTKCLRENNSLAPNNISVIFNKLGMGSYHFKKFCELWHHSGVQSHEMTVILSAKV